MASILRQIVAGPRLKHPEANLDLCYVTDNIIATSGPSSTYPQKAYRNPTADLVRFLDHKHGEDWSIWEFRAEGTGYPDSEVYGRIHHYPWPDHHPPPFALIPNIMASMRDWLHHPAAESGKRVVVVHCKAGKGRSGTVAASYLISQEGWTVKDALQRFTERRMRLGFGSGVSIPSQVRWIDYVDLWTRVGKTYVDRKVEVLEVHVWGLRDGVSVAVDCYVEEGRKIKRLHAFSEDEKFLMDAADNPVKGKTVAKIDTSQESSTAQQSRSTSSETGGKMVIFRPANPILVPASDICIDMEQRKRAPYGWTMVTAVAHVWFNTFFEGLSLEETPSALDRNDSGVFEIAWDALDGLKGSSKKGMRALDKIAVVWRDVRDRPGSAKVIDEPSPGQQVPETHAADWRGADAEEDIHEDKQFGLKNEGSNADTDARNTTDGTTNAKG